MKQKVEDLNELKKISQSLRRTVLKMTSTANSGHPGGSMSAADLITALYFNKMNFDSENLKDENRDRFLMSKGHCSPIVYATLSKLGLFSEQELIETFRQVKRNLRCRIWI